jgi:hypothetical protein
MKCALFCVLAMSVCLPAMTQQTDINRYTVYTGFDYLISPARNLTQRGFDVDFGVTAKPWLGLGGDFSASGNAIISGGGTINGTETVYAPTLIAANAQNPLVPLPNMITVPFKSTTYTFAAGPQFYVRKWKKVTFLVRPGLGGIYESADLTFPARPGRIVPTAQYPSAETPSDRFDLVHWRGGWLRSQLVQTRGAPVYSRLDQHSPVL